MGPGSDEAPRTSDNPGFIPQMEQPSFLGRYRVTGELGVGGFGRVFLGHDDELNRPVAIKVPHVERLASAADVESYISEARIVASLDHAHIVPVYDVGHTANGLCFVVSKYIAGGSLATRLLQRKFSSTESAELVATLAEALDYAHRQGLTHRDIKPGNILIDDNDQPYLVDFGLALRERDFGKGARFAGTPAYMSPEQARQEGHRVDGRSDLFSLGVVFYEMLTGQRPFLGTTVSDLLTAITSSDPQPLRAIDLEVPRQLERICLKALSKKASQRYATGHDMAQDLRDSLAGLDALSAPDASGGQLIPRGLRSFEARDASSFQRLLPGARDRDGLPESVAFWKNRIEATGTLENFEVGVIYGPSGCGKSSLVKAGLLPRLGRGVVPVYLECTPRSTEAHLLKRLGQECGVSSTTSLVDAVAAIRRGQADAPGKKLLIVLDQFEQWLHSDHDRAEGELVQALRQCDGANVQCLILVRDDFWMLASRFMEQLDIPIAQGVNAAAIDLFDLAHARKVLREFGLALGRFPAGIEKQHEQFLDRASASLAEEGRVIPVRLALFAEMIKNKPWTSATLDELGGAEGVGITFLEETFGERITQPRHRYHQRAAREVLKALLPEQGLDIKGSMLSKQELLEQSGYSARPANFDELLRILDGELRLITPAGSAEEDASGECYQLTHDFLVPPLRDWLTRKQRETRQGRAALRLQESALRWTKLPTRRQLPVLWEWVNIELFSRHALWSAPEARMMAAARRHHLSRLSLFAVFLVACAFLGLTMRRRMIDSNRATEAAGLVQELLDAETAQVPDIVQRIDHERQWADPLLQQALASAPADSKASLHLRLALLPVDEQQVNALYQRLLAAAPGDLLVVRAALETYAGQLTPRLWKAADQPAQRLRAAAALALYDPRSKQWQDLAQAVADDLVSVNPVYLGPWLRAFAPVGNELISPLSAIFRDQQRDASERTLATTILSQYAGNRPDIMAELIMDASEGQFRLLLPLLPAASLKLFRAELGKQPAADWAQERRNALARRKANAGIALCWSDRVDVVLPAFKADPDPCARSYLIERLGMYHFDSDKLFELIGKQSDTSIQRGLLLALGCYQPDKASLDRWLPRLLELYRQHPDPGIHADISWLLRTWNADKELAAIDRALATGQRADKARWYRSRLGHNLVVIPGPVEFVMGSPQHEVGRDGGAAGTTEKQRSVRITRSFAIADREVTVDQFLRFHKDHPYNKIYAPGPDQPINSVTWYEAAAYCNWLSKQEGLPEEQWCYLPGKDGKFAEGMRLAPDYLQRTGYRLPLEEEWEYACRAGTTSMRYYGNTDELLPFYACYFKNSLNRDMKPVARLKPNGLGLFDTLGNALEWCGNCFDIAEADPSAKAASTDEILDRDPRVLRGGSFLSPAANVRAAFRDKYQPADVRNNVSFRVARTLPAGP
ncbi:MAG: SUMF1/EgtB/PvdO family nonheme iron enzyme [Gemmataceae bacterium]